MRVLFVTTEITPFAKVGKLANYSNFLPAALSSKGVETVVFAPYYRTLMASRNDISPISEDWFDVYIGKDRYGVRFLQTVLGENGPKVVFVECEPMFGRDGVYANPSDGRIFPDNYRRFILLQKAAIEFILHGHFRPDIIHLNDHSTAMLPALIKQFYSEREELKGIKTLLTIHDVKYQGNCSRENLREAGIDDSVFNGECFNNGAFNCLRAGIATADRINTVSPTYALETVNDDEAGAGLSACLRSRGSDYFGILNGVDYTNWNPKKDPDIKLNFGVSRPSDKLENKIELLARHGLDHSNAEDVPLIGIVCDLTEAKGMTLVSQAIDKMMPWEMRMIIAGSGDPRYHRMFEQAQMRFPNKLGLNLTPSHKLVHLIMAGCDFFLIPSRIEPCGEHQFYSMRYGTIPIARATGGLADSIEDYNPDTKEGWGFLFYEYDSQSLLKTVWRAISLFKEKSNFQAVQKRAMRLDFSWEICSERYLEAYRSLLGQ